MEGEKAVEPVDLTTPNVARMYDFYLGGKDHFAADREAAEQILRIAPFTPRLAAQNRAFLRRSVRFLSARGIRQFLDLGAGLPTRGNVHEIVHGVDPGARVVYVDNDPVVVAHGRAILESDDTLVRVIKADLREPGPLLAHPGVLDLIDLDQPVGLLMNSVLHCLADDEGPDEIVDSLLAALAPGSYLVISHVTGDDQLTSASAEVYRGTTTGIAHRSAEQVGRFFAGLDLLEPGVVPLSGWRPETEPGADWADRGPDDELDRYYLCGVGRKPVATPRPLLSRPEEADPLGPLSLPSGDTVTLATRHADVQQVLADPAFTRELYRHAGSPRLVAGTDINDDRDSLLNMDGPRHSRLRRIVAKTFTPKRIESWRPRVEEIAHRLVDDMISAGSPADLVEALTFPLPVTVISELLGVPAKDAPRFRAWADSSLSTATSSAGERATAVREFLDYIAGFVAIRTEEPGDALIDLLIQARDEDGSLTEGELVSLVKNMVTAGHETTAKTLAAGVFTMLAQPGLYAALVRDPSRIPAAVEEMLRYCMPAEMAMPRLATCPVALHSGPIEQGHAVVPALAAANRDPRTFPDPDSFVIDRPENPHVSFGHGPHFCLGAGLARMEMQAALAELVRRLPGLSLTHPSRDVTWTSKGLVRGPEELSVTW
ncbi:cytochrome P450 [Actinocorallia longicatena]|uniref:Cytochrome P450 n=1 Tax=Actinocorallia longicatena TaxID=111803 RepID=A0ABP6QM06_9ACTN